MVQEHCVERNAIVGKPDEHALFMEVGNGLTLGGTDELNRHYLGVGAIISEQPWPLTVLVLG